MNKYWKYFKYLLKHKFYVFKFSCEYGIPARGLFHDMSKFLPDEFIPYARYFYGDYPTEERWVYHGKTKEQVCKEFDNAWLKHIHRNKHHWQHWILQEDDGDTKKLFIPEDILLEMLSDWHGAGLAITGCDNIQEWWSENKSKIIMNDNAFEFIDNYIKKESE